MAHPEEGKGHPASARHIDLLSVNHLWTDLLF